MNRIAVVAVVAVAALVATGCGSSKKSSSSTSSSSTATSTQSPSSTAKPTKGKAAGGAQLKLSADPSGALKFTTSSLTAKSGKVTITMSNPSSIPHAIAVEGSGIDKKGKVAGQGGSSMITVALKPGTYTFYCPVDGHRQAGMKGTLTVK
ncbi:MAG: cupredoxin domain-containing protein [Actinobacteria bacterium]|nr:cupredoxin domain-containing protein [Actinomycetota bacterium]